MAAHGAGVDPEVPFFRNISITDVQGTGCLTAGAISGLGNISVISGLALTRVHIQGLAGGEKGAKICIAILLRFFFNITSSQVGGESFTLLETLTWPA